MNIGRSLLAVLTTCAVLALLVFGLLFQVYGSNDDVAIRILLEGRMFPDTDPVPWVIFINLALGQALADLYQTLPGVPWYDIYEQGLLWTSCAVILFLTCRNLGGWASGGVLACVILAILCTLVEVQFTTVAMTAALAGSLAIGGILPAQRGRLEPILLTVLGVLLIVGGAALRTEAAAMMLIYLLGVVALVWVSRWRLPALSTLAWRGTAALGAVGIVALLVVYHLRGFRGDPQWWAYYVANSLRGAIHEYAPVRAGPEAIAAAAHAAGWSDLDYNLLNNHAPLDPSHYSDARYKAFLAALPPLGEQLNWPATLGELALYPFRSWYLGAAFLAIPAARIARRSAWLFAGANLGFVGLVLAISLVLKPPPHHVFWPLLAGHLLVLTIIMPRRRTRAPPALVTALVGVALLSLALHAVEIQWRARREAAWTEAYLQHHAKDPTRLVLIIAGEFPYERAERPFQAPVMQASLRAIPTGAYSWSPLLYGKPEADLGALICGPSRPEILMREDRIHFLARFYAEERQRHVIFQPTFANKRIHAWRCADPAAT